MRNKPSSVRRLSIASRQLRQQGGIISLGHGITAGLKQPTRDSSGTGRASSPIWPCYGWGLPCDPCYQRPGALLPHRFTLACAASGHRRSILCGTFRRLATPGRYPAPCPVELGLSSSKTSSRHASDPYSHAPHGHENRPMRPDSNRSALSLKPKEGDSLRKGNRPQRR